MRGETRVFGSLGFTEIAFILILALLLFGPKKLPEIGKTLGKGLAEFKRASNELKRTLESEVEEDERATRRAAAQLAPVPSATAPAPVAAGGAVAQGSFDAPAPEPAEPPAPDLRELAGEPAPDPAARP